MVSVRRSIVLRYAPPDKVRVVFGMKELNEKDWELIRCIQGDLPHDREPFTSIASKLGWTEDEVLERIKAWMEQGIIRRFGALVRHQHVGFAGNAMVAWSFPDAEVDRAGERMAGYPFISHCYERPSLPGWPFNLYTMFHAPCREDIWTLVERVAQDTGATHYRILYTLKEWKKESMTYLK